MKNVVITGSTRGIGLGLAKRFLEAGFQVTINGRTQNHVDDTLKKLKGLYPNAKIVGYSGSTGDYQSMEGLWDYAAQNFGEIDIWINNAGLPQERKMAWDVSTENYTNVINVNIIGVINGSKVAFNKMKKQGHGQIFNMEGFGSNGMLQEKMAIYGTSKRALRYFTAALAKEAKNEPIKIGTLSPGMVLTDFLLGDVHEKDDDYEKGMKVFNILADDVETVTAYLVRKILQNKKKNVHIDWLPSRKVMYRFLTAPITKRNVIDKLD